MPFIGMSALAIATIRPGTRGTDGGVKTASTPIGMTVIRAGSTPKSVTTSRAEVSEGHSTCGTARATLPCIRRKPYHRRSVSRLRQVGRLGQVDPAVERDRVVDRGDQRQPGARDVEHPVAQRLVVVDHVEVGEPLAQRVARTRRAKVRGSGKPAVHIVATSSRSVTSRISEGRGVRNGSGSR